ncbi:tetratricopeptide repeat protein [Tautonia plasticadhaerens]|uniref:Tetratricopeptide repeat protein n=1 Tax=Tautonia plasticadhaerens TaxID=2527974 RepID=A0A518H0E8_9BACT|nr:hypothetical protein [Tautonia plasticadhaerens]QDV34291.1 hypothetical protein ElP_21760 [Tautonia plasticadhaerens]
MAIGAILVAMLVPAVQDPDRLDDRQVRELVESARRRFVEASIDREERARDALDAADRLDAAAQAEPEAGRRASRWDAAVDLLDALLMVDPGNPIADAVDLQAAVYRWAEGRTWIAQLERSPADPEARARAIEALDDAIARLRRLWTQTRGRPEGDLTAQNIRFRFAQALADRGDLEDDPGRALDARQQALGRLKDLPLDPPLAGHATLLRARLLVELGELGEAEEALRQAEDMPGPGEAERLDVQLDLLLARKQFEEAIVAIERSGLDRPSKDVRAVRVRARQWIDLFPGRERSAVEEDAITRVRRLRDADRPEASPALARLAASIVEPDDADDPGLWELLAEGHLARGDVGQAVRVNQLGADHAERLGDPGRAWVMRYRAAAILVRAGRFDRAAEALGPLAELARTPGSPAPDDQRANASLLHALALGRLASSQGGSGAKPAYQQALEDHIAAFPDDPSASEARWILGRLQASEAREADAIALWSAVPRSHPRWRESRMAIVELHRDAVQSLLVEGKEDEARARLLRARAALDSFAEEAADPGDRNAFDLARAELELIPGLRSAEIGQALGRLDRLVASESDAARRDRARRLRIVALALDQQAAEAEREAREELDRSDPGEIIALAERLDRAAAAATAEPSRRRIAGVSRLLAERVLARPDGLDPGLRARARVVRLRGQLETGDLDGARASAQSWAGDLLPSRLPPGLLGPLADALDRLGLYTQSADVHRAIIASHPPGSAPWFEARYGLAVSYYRTGRPSDARRLIDGTSALHPDLGGDALREKFARLRRRLESP